MSQHNGSAVPNAVSTPSNNAPNALEVSSNEQAPEAIESNQEQEGGEEAAPAKEVAKRLKSLKLKVYGEEVNEDLPFEIDENPEAVEYLTKQLQLAKAAQRAMQENTTFQKQVQDFFKNLKGNTKQALTDMGIDPKEFAAMVIEEEIKKAEMSPAEREKQELQEKIRKMEEERKSEKEELTKKELEQLQQQEYERIDMQMSQALNGSDLPKSPYVIKKMAELMLQGNRLGYDVSPMDVLPLVREEIAEDLKQMFAAMPEDAVEAMIGKDVFNRVRKKNLAKAKGPTTPATEKSKVKDVGSQKSDKPSEKKMGYKDFFGI